LEGAAFFAHLKGVLIRMALNAKNEARSEKKAQRARVDKLNSLSNSRAALGVTDEVLAEEIEQIRARIKQVAAQVKK
jgi:hypothetical protein